MKRSNARLVFQSALLMWCLAAASPPLAKGGTGEAGDFPADQFGKWLVDRGRDLGLVTRDQPLRTDAEMIMVWMMAAARVSPQLAEAYWWQYDLAARLGQREAALAALRSYVRSQPDDAVARLTFIELSFGELQTTEERIAFCKRELAMSAQTHAPEVSSDLHRRIAAMYYGQGRPEAAADQAAKAIAAFPQNIAARQLLVGLQSNVRSLEMRLDVLLSTIAVSGGTGQELWELARFLDAVSMHHQARYWYDRTQTAFRRQDPSYQPSVAYLLDLARSAYDAGDYKFAIEQCQRARTADPAHLNAQLLLVRSARKLGRHKLADATIASIQKICKEVESAVFQQSDALSAAQIAWFHLDFDPNTHRSARFADFAYRIAPEFPAIRRVYGLCLLDRGEFEKAREALEPLADTDQLAADGFARILIKHGLVDKAIAVLRNAEKLRYSGSAYEQIVESLQELGELPAPIPHSPAAAAMLADFDREILNFAESPSQFISLDTAFDQEEVPFATPLNCSITLTNRGSFPVALGEGRMMSPQVLVAMSDDSTPADSSVPDNPTLWIPMTRRYVLNASDSIRINQTLSVGAIGELLRRGPLQRKTYTFSFILDPIQQADGSWASRLRNVKPIEVKLTRAPIDASNEGIERLAATLRASTFPQKAQAIESLVALLQARRNDRHGTGSARSIDYIRIKAALRAPLADPSPAVRALAVAALGTHYLERSTIADLAPKLSDPHWIVRLVTADTLASQQGEVFKPVLERMSNGDPDRLVRRLAALHFATFDDQPDSDKPAAQNPTEASP